jgi:hypothetical protein
MTAPGFEPQERTVECDGKKPLAVAVKLVAIVATGRVKFPPAAGGVTIAVDGKQLSPQEITEGVALPVGRHEVVFSGGGRPTVTQIIEVPPDAEVAVAPPRAESPQVAPSPPATPAASPVRPSPPAPAFSRGIYAGITGGAHLTLTEWNLGTDTKGAYPKSSGTGGLRVGVQLFPRLALEGEALWVGLPNRLDAGLGHGLTTHGSLLFHVLRGRWTPVLSAGAGTYQVLASDLRADVDLRLHAGLGLRGRVADWLAVRFDARDVITDGFDGGLGNNVELLLGIETYLWKQAP